MEGKMKNDELDNIDKMIITMLQENARMSLKEIAQKVYLSSPAVSARIENLVQNGYIEGFHARINPISYLDNFSSTLTMAELLLDTT